MKNFLVIVFSLNFINCFAQDKDSIFFKKNNNDFPSKNKLIKPILPKQNIEYTNQESLDDNLEFISHSYSNKKTAYDDAQFDSINNLEQNNNSLINANPIEEKVISILNNNNSVIRVENENNSSKNFEGFSVGVNFDIKNDITN